ncbi:MAG: hypothetical protein NT099_08270 [Candidatus Saganbacteria bacterium]|nr:hypothetical protein [Candidatus Saganbacteria bacterium]
MVYILIAGILGFVLGLLLIFFPITLEQINVTCNRVLVYLDEKLYAVRIPAGIILILMGIWFLLASKPITMKEAWILPIAGTLAVILGLLLAVFPKSLVKVSEWGNTMLVTTDEILVKARLSAGIVILLISIYLLFIASKL